MSNSDAGKGDNVVKRTNYKKFWENYPNEWDREYLHDLEESEEEGKDDND